VRKFLKILAGVLIVLFIAGYALYHQATTPPSRAENPVVKGVHYVGMTVNNLEHSSKLYSDSMNLVTVDQMEIANSPLLDKLAGRTGVKAKTSLMTSVNAQLRFMQFESPSEQAKQSTFVDANGPGIAHVCFQVNQNTLAYDKFLSGGGKHIGTPEMLQMNPKNPVYYAYARDLDNTMVEIEHVNIEALNLPTPPKNNYRIRHVSLATTDMNRAVTFYSKLLETKNPRRAGRLLTIKGEKVDGVSGLPQSEIEMAWFQVRNLELEIIQYLNPAPKAIEAPRPIDASGYNMIVFDVTDLHSAKERLLAAGGTIVDDKQSFDGEKILFGRDLDGNLLGFQVLPSHSPFSAESFKDNGAH
jgi:catechol 2,3-dioxygenase-like lactoylglutathione lyase family enzyme